MISKYGPGTVIKSSGEELSGQLYLEVPVQAGGTVPESILEYAARLDPPVTIRDVTGHVYLFLKGSAR